MYNFEYLKVSFGGQISHQVTMSPSNDHECQINFVPFDVKILCIHFFLSHTQSKAIIKFQM